MVWISESLLNWKTGFNKETIVIVPSKRPFSMLIYSPMCSLWKKNERACFLSPVVILGGHIFQHALWLPKLMCLYIFMHAQTISVCICGQEKFHFSKLHREIKAFSLCWNLFITKILLRAIPRQSGNPFSNQSPASRLQLPSSPPMSPWLQAHTDRQGIRITSRRSECKMPGSDPDLGFKLCSYFLVAWVIAPSCALSSDASLLFIFHVDFSVPRITSIVRTGRY